MVTQPTVVIAESLISLTPASKTSTCCRDRTKYLQLTAPNHFPLHFNFMQMKKLFTKAFYNINMYRDKAALTMESHSTDRFKKFSSTYSTLSMISLKTNVSLSKNETSFSTMKLLFIALLISTVTGTSEQGRRRNTLPTQIITTRYGDLRGIYKTVPGAGRVAVYLGLVYIYVNADLFIFSCEQIVIKFKWLQKIVHLKDICIIIFRSIFDYVFKPILPCLYNIEINSYIKFCCIGKVFLKTHWFLSNFVHWIANAIIFIYKQM